MSDYEAGWERFLLARIEDIQKRARQEAEPYLAQLARIHARRPPPPLIITSEQAEAWGLNAVLRTLAEEASGGE